MKDPITWLIAALILVLAGLVYYRFSDTSDPYADPVVAAAPQATDSMPTEAEPVAEAPPADEPPADMAMAEPEPMATEPEPMAAEPEPMAMAEPEVDQAAAEQAAAEQAAAEQAAAEQAAAEQAAAEQAAAEQAAAEQAAAEQAAAEQMAAPAEMEEAAAPADAMAEAEAAEAMEPPMAEAESAPKPAPVAPAPAVVEETAPADTNLAFADVTFDNGAATFSGSGAPGSVVRMSIDDKPIGMFSVPKAGKWHFRVKSTIAPGSRKLKLEQLGPDGAVVTSSSADFEQPA